MRILSNVNGVQNKENDGIKDEATMNNKVKDNDLNKENEGIVWFTKKEENKKYTDIGLLYHYYYNN